MTANVRLFPYLTIRAAGFPAEALHSLAARHADIPYDLALAEGYRALAELSKHPEFRRALLFASHDLLAQLPRLEREGPINKNYRHAAQGVLQYLSRMAYRISPLSRFTTVEVAPLSELLPDPDAPVFDKAVVTPSVAWLGSIWPILTAHAAFRQILKVRLNPSLQVDESGSYRWLFYSGETESIQNSPPSPMIDFLIETIENQNGAIDWSRLMSILIDAVDADADALEAACLEWIDLGLIEWDWPVNAQSPAWCDQLYRLLGRMPVDNPVLVEAAQTALWLRTTAKAAPYLPIEEAVQALREGRERLEQFHKNNGETAPNIPPEQIFFEDIERQVRPLFAREEIENLAASFVEIWRNLPAQPLSGLRLKIRHVSALHGDRPMPFIDFCENVLQTESVEKTYAASPAKTGKIALVFQPFRGKNGELMAILQGITPGGGRMMARWSHLFPEKIEEAFVDWNKGADAVAFPVQGFYNANFQPPLFERALMVPAGAGALARNRSAKPLRLGDLFVGVDQTDRPRLFAENRPIDLIDLGLEDIGARPPFMQILTLLGSPYISGEWLALADWKPLYPKADFIPLEYRPRQTTGSWILGLARWRIPMRQVSAFTVLTGEAFYNQWRAYRAATGIPRYFRAQTGQQPPRIFDAESPLWMLAFEKWLKQSGDAPIITEMPALPEQFVLENDAGRVAGEVVMEICY